MSEMKGPSTLLEALQQPLSLLRDDRNVVKECDVPQDGDVVDDADVVGYESVDDADVVGYESVGDGSVVEKKQSAGMKNGGLKDPREWFYPEKKQRTQREGGEWDDGDLSEYELNSVDSESDEEDEDDDMTVFDIRDRDSMGTSLGTELDSARNSLEYDEGLIDERVGGDLNQDYGGDDMELMRSHAQNKHIDDRDVVGLLDDGGFLADEAPLPVLSAATNRAKSMDNIEVNIPLSARVSDARSSRGKSLLRKSAGGSQNSESRRSSAMAGGINGALFDYESDDTPRSKRGSIGSSGAKSRRVSAVVAEEERKEAVVSASERKKRRSSVSFARMTTNIPPVNNWNTNGDETEPEEDLDAKENDENQNPDVQRPDKAHDNQLPPVDDDSGGEDFGFAGMDDEDYGDPPEENVLGDITNEERARRQSLRIDSNVKSNMALSISPYQQHQGNLMEKFNEVASPVKTKKRKRAPSKRTGPKKKKAKKEFVELPLEEAAIDYRNTPGRTQHNGKPVRRSKRNRFAPLKFWKNETMVYERRKSQTFPTICAVVELPETPSPVTGTPLTKFDKRRFEVSRITPLPPLPPADSPSTNSRLSDMSTLITPTPDRRGRRRLRPKFALSFSDDDATTPIITPR